ncbi:hypothetical protein D9M71_709010 [compost metagenome]
MGTQALAPHGHGGGCLATGVEAEIRWLGLSPPEGNQVPAGSHQFQFALRGQAQHRHLHGGGDVEALDPALGFTGTDVPEVFDGPVSRGNVSATHSDPSTVIGGSLSIRKKS